ncbi:MAG: ROK family protein [Pseudomonadota bacterium]
MTTTSRPIAVPTGRSPSDQPNVLVIDIGAANMKFWCSGTGQTAAVPTGPTFSPVEFEVGLRTSLVGWAFDSVTVGIPTGVLRDRVYGEPHNMGTGWVGFDIQSAFAKPTHLINDAVMQALGSYRGGTMLFLGLGTGLGTALVADGKPIGLEIQHLPYKDGMSYEDWTATRAVERLGVEGWREALPPVVKLLKDATVAEYVVLGGGNLRLLEELPPDCHQGHNANAFLGGYRIWAGAEAQLQASAS